MKHTSMFTADEVYCCANCIRLTSHRVSHQDLGNFSLELKRFLSALGPLVDDDYWRLFTRTLKRRRFEWSSAPLPFNYKDAEMQVSVDALSRHLVNCEQVFSGFASQARHLVDIFSGLTYLSDNPFLAAIKSILGEKTGDTALLILKSSLIHAVENMLDSTNLRGTKVVSVSQLRDEVCYSKLIVIGPARWFPEYIFTAPRATEIHLVKYDWFSDIWERESVFLGHAGAVLHTNPNRLVAQLLSESEKPEVGKTLPGITLDPEEVMPKVNWEQIKFKAMAGDSGMQIPEGDNECVEAHLLVLEGDIGVLIDSSEGAKSTIIDLDQEGSGQVYRVPMADLEPDMFILLRTGGGGEYIVEVANRLLGKEANRARDVQRNWKSLLRKVILERSAHQIVTELRRLGSARASEVNLRNWVSYRTIRTEDYSDFQAIMRLVGLEKEEEEYWATMAMIDSAHRRAGQLIRRLLLNRVRSLNLEQLRKLGKMDFELSDAETGSLTAFRIKHIDKEPIEVPVHHLGKPFDLEVDQWQ